MVAVDDSVAPADFRHGGMEFGRTFFSASLLKVAAMYTAYQLRKQVNDFSAEHAPGLAGRATRCGRPQ